MTFLSRYKQTILYGIALAAIIFIIRWFEIRYVLADDQMDTYIGIIALLFTGLGIWIAAKLRRPKVETVIIEKEVRLSPSTEFVLNEAELKRLNLSKRELEVLQLMAEGLSNQEIADKLFVSLNTIKTHSAQLFGKMDVRRRTQAVETGKRLGLIP
ncbi:response regulator transcription factor [Mucilaginibacter sp.]|uniref:response regulator transcription factor n=1 Tax=Mucilaginibacter sp. TaxID=1882438 RepID=UPI002C1C68D0|nr:response regulator transcription factor [Mucilaginibacter sp.]HTI57952.1 response regulator transcription factor [Mucilaginibacter sp.]